MTAHQYIAHGNTLDRELAEKTVDLKALVKVAAKAQSEYKAERAKRRLIAKARGEAKTDADASDVADSDPKIQALHMEYLDATGQVAACTTACYAWGKRLGWGQTIVATDREMDKQHALSGGTAFERTER